MKKISLFAIIGFSLLAIPNIIGLIRYINWGVPFEMIFFQLLAIAGIGCIIYFFVALYKKLSA